MLISRKRRLGAAPFALLLACVLAGTAVPRARAQAGPGTFSFPMHDREVRPLGGIIIEGNDHTDQAVVLRIMGFRIGQMVSRQDVDAAWDRLEDSGYFRTVDVDFDDSEDEAVLEVTVEEDLRTYYGPVVRYDRRFKYLLGAYVEQRNFRGRGETLRLEGVGLYPQQGRLTWDRPWFLGRTGLSAHVEAGYQQGDFVFRPTRLRKWEASASIRHAWEPFFVEVGLARGGFEQRDGYRWPIPDAMNTFMTSEPGRYPAHSENYVRFDGAVGLDTRSNPYYPRRGIYLEGRLRQWDSEDYRSYLESTGDARLFVTLPWKHHILAMHAWGRTTDGRHAPLDNRLYLGGPETVRGYPFGQRDGEHGYLLSAEYRMPLFLMPISPQGELVGVGLHLFADAGDAWYDGADAGEAMQSAGAGLHLNLDTLQLRFEAARTREGDWGFEFMDHFNF